MSLYRHDGIASAEVLSSQFVTPGWHSCHTGAGLCARNYQGLFSLHSSIKIYS